MYRIAVRFFPGMNTALGQPRRWLLLSCAINSRYASIHVRFVGSIQALDRTCVAPREFVMHVGERLLRQRVRQAGRFGLPGHVRLLYFVYTSAPPRPVMR
jgi:hypothetical protein